MNKEVEFCLNSKRYIERMALKGQPPKSCPYRSDNFMTCENCGYYSKRKPSKYFLRIKKAIKELFNDK